MNLPLEYPIFLILIPLGLVAVFRLARQKSGLGFSSAILLKGIRTGPSLLLLERLFLSIFVVVVSLVLARPIRQEKTSVPIYQEARDITLALDISGSMAGNGIKTAANVITEFVAGRPQDRIALFVFNSKAYLDWPLSLDHETLVFRLNHEIADGSTRIASGLIAGLKHQQAFGQNPGAIIVVSDGGSTVTSEERSVIEAALGQTELYWIWIGAENDQVARQFGVYVTSLGGKVYRGELAELAGIFSEINKLEASPVLYEQRVTTIYNFGALPLLALASLLLAGLVNTIREI